MPPGSAPTSGTQFRDDQGQLRFNLLGWNGTDPAPACSRKRQLMTRRPRPPATDQQPLIWKIASVLLQYPDSRVYHWLDDLTAALPQVHDPTQGQALASVVRWLHTPPPTQAARHHVETFDLNRRCSPYPTYYRYGDTRQRGMVLLGLKHTYRRAGLDPTGSELADYLPAVLEFAALAPADAGHKLVDHPPGRPGVAGPRAARHRKPVL